MNVEQFKKNLVKVSSPENPRRRKVLQEIFEGLLPSNPSDKVQEKHAEAYEIDGVTVILSRFVSLNPKHLVLINFETGEMFAHQLC